jgi:uncharacterized tellurite resistance protein B-like protein
MSIWKFLGLSPSDGPEPAAASSETETIRKIVDALDRLEADRARYIAAFAYILSRVANADMQISAEETRAMERIVIERGGLPEEQAIMVVQIAKSQNRLFGGTEDYLVTREFGRIADREQKLALLHCLFAVSAVDKSIISAEDTEIRKIASEIKLSHADFIGVKSQYTDHLEALKELPDSDAE